MPNITKVIVQPIVTQIVDVIIGSGDGGSMLQNKQTDKTKDILEGYWTNKKGKKREIDDRTREEIAQAVTHKDNDGNVVFPVSGIKKAMLNVCAKVGLYKNDVFGIFIMGSYSPIKYKKRVINIAWGRTKGRNATPKICIRPEFIDWSMKLVIKYNSTVITPQNIVDLLNAAGFYYGLGDWRPEKGGSYGMYQVKKS